MQSSRQIRLSSRFACHTVDLVGLKASQREMCPPAVHVTAHGVQDLAGVAYCADPAHSMKDKAIHLVVQRALTDTTDACVYSL